MTSKLETTFLPQPPTFFLDFLPFMSSVYWESGILRVASKRLSLEETAVLLPETVWADTGRLTNPSDRLDRKGSLHFYVHLL